MLDINTAITKIRKFHDTAVAGENTRYRSWVHCFNAFRTLRHDKNNVDLLCLHLAWYMASWGMLRGRSFLLQMDYLVHKPLVQIILSGKYDFLFDDAHCAHMIPLTIELSDDIHKAYDKRSISCTFVTKIILGVFGIAPAYDRYFRRGAQKYSICSTTFNKKSLQALWSFYEQHFIALEALRKELTIEGINYTPMKLIDMCLFQIGVDDEKERKHENP